MSYDSFQIDEKGRVREMKKEPQGKFCPECRKITVGCGHEKQEIEPEAILSDKELLLVAERTAKGIKINPKIARVDGREEALIHGNRTITPFFMDIPAGTSANVLGRPQVMGKPVRLVYGGPPKTFTLLDIRVGHNSQFSCPGEVPMECFPPHPEPGEPINNILGMDRFQVGFSLTLNVRNITNEPQTFGAFILSEQS